MNFDDLKLFQEVASQLSFARVAELRQTDPSTISKAIQRIEERTGALLFSRTTRSMKLTEQGALFLNRSAFILDQWHEALDTVHKQQRSLSGTIRFTCSTAMASMIHGLVSEFLQDQKELQLEWIVSDTQLDFVEHQIDCGIRISPFLTGTLKARKLFPMEYGLFAATRYLKNHPISKIDHLTNNPLFNFYYEPFRQAWLIIWKGRTHKIEPKAQLVVSNASIMKNLIQSANGIGIMAKIMLKKEIENGEVCEVFEGCQLKIHSQPSAAWLVYRQNPYLPRRIRVFMDFLSDSLTQLAAN